MTAKIRFCTLLTAAALLGGWALTPAGSTPAVAATTVKSAKTSKLWSPGNGTAINDPNYQPGQSLAPLVRSVRSAVVSVTGQVKSSNERSGPWFFPQAPQQGLAQGSGFLVHPDGWVITNHHVIDGQDKLEISLWDGQSYKAKVVGSDPQTDIALVKLLQPKGKKRRFPFVQLGSSDALSVGDWVVAIGNPMGLQHSVTRGIVSAKSRGDLGLYRQGYADFLQTDAAISPGNSGGPLFNLKGEVIAINTAINRAGNDLGFAVPIDQAKPIIDQLHQHGEVRRGWLGITGSMVRKVNRGTQGAQVADVLPNGPAAKAGIMAKDVIISIDQQPIHDFKQLRQRIAGVAPGETLSFELRRDGKTLRKKVTLARQPTAQEMARHQRRTRSGDRGDQLFGPGTPRLGVRVKPDKKGLRIHQIADPNGVAADLGLKAGDVLLQVNGDKITDVQSLRAALAKDSARISVSFERNGQKNQSTLRVQ